MSEADAWALFNFQGTQLLVKGCAGPDFFSLLVTDMVEVWEDRSSRAELEETNARLNAQFEIDFHAVVETLKECTHGQNLKAQYSLQASSEEKIIRIQIPKFSFQYHWEFVCKRTSPTRLHGLITLPLQTLTYELHRRMTALKV